MLSDIGGYLKETQKLLISVLKISVLLLFIVISIYLIQSMFGSNNHLAKIDEYFKIILASWPAVFFILGTNLFLTQRSAIEHFIKNRITKVGLDGVFAERVTRASEGEIREKNISDAKNEVELSNISGTGSFPLIETNIIRPAPNTTNENTYQKYKEKVHVEEIVQAKLISTFGARYKSQVKLIDEKGRSVILDGILRSFSDAIWAVEIKYIPAVENYLALHYILSRMKEKLLDYKIKKMIVILVYNELTLEKAIQIRESIKAKVTVYFFNLTKEDELEPILLPPKNKSLF